VSYKLTIARAVAISTQTNRRFTSHIAAAAAGKLDYLRLFVNARAPSKKKKGKTKKLG
jgi:hypothetical protein